MNEDEIENFTAMAQMLREAGYIVFKAECDHMDRTHGRHVLKTRSAVCEGTPDAPHGYHSCHMGTFGMWVNCACGHSFAGYAPEDEPSDWENHKTEHSIV